MNYQQTLDWLFQQLASFQRVGGSAYNGDLTNIISLCSLLDNPHRDFKSIHVAGTNGKGSTCHMISSVLQEQGYKVGLYTSPHLKDFRERIRVNGDMISKDEVVGFVTSRKQNFIDIGLSFFEMTTALAFQHFSNQKVDIAVIETGLGGRLDATNIIIPELSVITNVALDHQNLLGDTIELIAKEKVGIIKKGISVVLGSTSKEVQDIVSKSALAKDAPLFISKQKHTYSTSLLGSFQQENIATVCEVLCQLKNLGWMISEKAMKDGLHYVVENTKLRGRWEIISDSPKVICDTGHNLHAMRSILMQLQNASYRELWMVIGFVGDKDIDGILSMMPVDAKYVFCQPNIPRALSVHRLEECARKYFLDGIIVQNPADALKEAKSRAHKDDLVFVGGSTFVVAEVL